MNSALCFGNLFSRGVVNVLVLVMVAAGYLAACDGGSGASNTDPVANAGPDQNVRTGDLVTLDGSASMDANGDPLIYRWSFLSMPTTSTVSLSNPGEARPYFRADRDGVFVVSLVVNDGKTDSAADTVTVTTSVVNSPAVANAGPDQTVPLGTVVALDGSGSTDADGDVLQFSWTFVSRPVGTTASFSDMNSVRPTFPADRNGDYVITLRVTDCRGSESFDTVTVTVWTPPAAPRANAGLNRSVITGSVVGLDGSKSADPNDDPLNYRWSIRLKPAGSTTALYDSTSIRPTFTSDRDGVYVINLVVNDGSFDSPIDTVMITAAPVAIGVSLPATGYTVSYAAGDDGYYHKGVVWHSPRFTDHGDGTVTDRLTGLMWPRSPDGIKRFWSDALPYAEGLSLCGYTDWRLPNINEITSLANADERSTQWLGEEGFLTVPTVLYWSSTSSVIWMDPSPKWTAYLPHPHQGKDIAEFEFPTTLTLTVRGGR